MSSVKVCTKCGIEKSVVEFRERSDRPGTRKAECIECERERNRERWVRKGRPKQGWAKLPYAEWTDEMQAAHRVSKEKERRARGARLRSEIAAAAREREAKKIAEMKRARVAREERIAARPYENEAEKFRWRYQNDAKFRERQKERTRKAKAKVPLWYANNILGGNSRRYYPMELLLAKQIQLRIKRNLKEKEHEEH